MKRLAYAALAFVIAVPGLAQQTQPQPTAEQITIQLLEQEVKNYRSTISQLAVQLNAVTKERDELKTKEPVKK